MLNNLRIALADIDTADHNLSNPNVNFVALGEQVAPDNGSGPDALTYTEPRYYGPIPAPTYSSSPCYGNPEGYDASDITSECFGGYLYNWCAATGATSNTCILDVDDTLPPITNATVDICPAGWKLPTSKRNDNNEGDFFNLYYNALDGDYNNIQFTGSFRGVLAGHWIGLIVSMGAAGGLWSSSGYSSNSYYAFLLLFSSTTSVEPVYYDRRAYGYAVRCLLD
jgi:uncharacterized protein (TIGR02145 family)